MTPETRRCAGKLTVNVHPCCYDLPPYFTSKLLCRPGWDRFSRTPTTCNCPVRFVARHALRMPYLLLPPSLVSSLLCSMLLFLPMVVAFHLCIGNHDSSSPLTDDRRPSTLHWLSRSLCLFTPTDPGAGTHRLRYDIRMFACSNLHQSRVFARIFPLKSRRLLRLMTLAFTWRLIAYVHTLRQRPLGRTDLLNGFTFRGVSPSRLVSYDG